jgi:dTDP-4-dehydrorhamnose reductase
MVEKILIIGQDSQIGSFLKKKLKNFNLYGTTRHKDRVSTKTLFFDLEEPTFQIDFSRFDAAIICASVTNLQKCNQKIEECERINVQNTIKLIDILSSHNCFSVFLSSNAVFDGKKPFYDIHSKVNPGV